MSVDKLNHLGLIRFSGEDAKSFLQGQLTNDLEQLGSHWHYSGYCNPKGRLLALFAIWRDNNDYLAILPKDLIDSTIKRLRMYVMRSKVVIDECESARMYGIFDESVMQQNNIAYNDSNRSTVVNPSPPTEAEQVWSLNFGSRWMVIDLQGTSLPALVDSKESADRWLIANVEDGLPAITSLSAELFIPQMINLDVMDGISFKKGCYTGQEIVARMHYLGKLKQRMFLFKVEQPHNGDGKSLQTDSEQTLPKQKLPGQKVFCDRGCEKSVGHIASAARNDSVLAVIRLDAVNGPLYLETGETLNLLEQQPYPLKTD